MISAHKAPTNKDGKRFFNHSTFTGGDVVVCAGELSINAQGRLLTIDNASGHYQPTGDHLRAALTILRDDYGVGFAAVQVSVASKDTIQVWNSGTRFSPTGGRTVLSISRKKFERMTICDPPMATLLEHDHAWARLRRVLTQVQR